MCTSDRGRSRRHAGFTLVELVIFIVVVSAGLAGILAVMNTAVKSSADPLVRKQTVALAEALLEEIVLKEFANPTDGYSGSSRALFDDVSDYHGYSTSGGVVDVNGSPIAGLSRYDVTSVAVAATSDLTGVDSSKAKKITVTVTGPGGAVTLSAYRTDL